MAFSWGPFLPHRGDVRADLRCSIRKTTDILEAVSHSSWHHFQVKPEFKLQLAHIEILDMLKTRRGILAGIVAVPFGHGKFIYMLAKLDNVFDQSKPVVRCVKGFTMV